MANRINTKAELTFYGFRGNQITRPRWNTIATQLGVRPSTQRFASISDASNKKSKVYKDFVKSVKAGIQQKYTFDNQLVVQPWTMSYSRRWNTGKLKTKWSKVTTAGVVQGKRYEIAGLVATAVQERQEQIEEDSPTESQGFSEPSLGEQSVAPVNGGRLVSKGIRVARMRKMGALKLADDYCGDTSWDLNQDTCVFDYLFHKYAGKSGFKKSLPIDDREKAYTFLDVLFSDNSLEEGVTIEQLKKFCDRFDIGMIALDKNENLIEYVKSQNSNSHPLIFIICNNHFYPIEDKNKRLSVSQKNKEADKPDEEKANWKSDDYAFENMEAKEKNYKVVYPQEGEETGNTWAVNKIMELGVMPMPRTLRVVENVIHSFVIDDTLYLSEKPSEGILEYCGENFSGQSSNTILYECWKEFDAGYAIDTEVDENGELVEVIEKPVSIKSVFNPDVWKTLMADGVKYRTHYGATRDLTDLLVLLPPVKGLETYEEIETETFKDIFTGELRTNHKTITKTKEIILEEPKIEIQKLLETGEAISIDINKCYSACLKNPYDNWLRYTLEDVWEDYDGELKSGLYYVETDDLTLLHKTNIYSNKIIELAMMKGICLTITKQLVHKKVYETETDIPKDYFEPLLEIIKDKTGGKTLMKELNNMISGYLGKTHNKTYTAELDEDPDAIWRHFLSCERPEIEDDFVKYFFKEGLDETGYTRFTKDNLVLNTLYGSDEKKLYLYGYEIRSNLNENTLPLYIQILDWANMRLYELGEKMGGEIIYRHTDCVVSIGGKIPELSDAWGGYKLEPLDKEKNWKSIMKENRAIDIAEFRSNWKHNPALTNSNDWLEIINYAIDNGGLLIKGRAGTGKSYVPKSAFQAGLMNLADSVKVDEYGKETKTYSNTKTMSFTNKASRNIMGTTIHKLLHINSAGTLPRKTMAGLKRYKYFVIDEIGMINSQLWKYLLLLKKENPKAIFILLGDWRQLPPIEEQRTNKLDVFNHPVVRFLCNNNSIELSERQRYDKALWDFLEKGIDEDAWLGINEKKVMYNEIYENKSICYYNKTRVKINKLCMDYFKQQTDSIFLEHKIEDLEDRRQSVYLYDGLPIMSWKNCVKLGIVNSEEFLVKSWSDEKIFISREEGGEDLEIDTDDFHDYFVPNYCSTTHKSQGATYKGKVILWDWNRMITDKEVVYTACSRATKLENLVIATGIQE